MAPTQEGGGETMVAIIQGLRDAGLAVTLMNAPRGYFSQKPGRSRRVSVYRADVETNTEWPRRTHSAQICDSHYATSYQLAHYRLNPTSPLVELPECPIQRGASTRNRGNFRVGQSSHVSTTLKYSTSRGTFCAGRVPPCDRFAASLRKYPLGRSLSTELLQRLLETTQAKYLSKIPTRSMRSIHSPRISHNKCNKATNKSNNKSNTSTNKCGKVNKDIQTYTRMVNEIVKEKEKVKVKRSKKNVSVEAAVSTNLLDQPNQSSECLKPLREQSRTYIGRGSEVRYLSDVRRVIRDTVRQMVDATSTVPCANAACRYKEHKRLHHRSDNSTSPLETESEENRNDSQLSENYEYLRAGGCDRSSCTEQRRSVDSTGQCSELCIEEVKKFIQKTIKQMVDCNPTCSKKLSICKDKGLQFFKDTVSTPTQIQEEDDKEEISEENSNSGTKVDAQTSDAYVCPGSRSAVCPNYMHRYRQHRKLYHDEEVEDEDVEKEEEVTAPEFCYPPPKTKPSFFSLGKPCICDDDKKRDSLNDVMVYVDDDDEYSSEAIDVDIGEEVMTWITQLPVYTDNTGENQAKILEKTEDLIDKLNALKGKLDNDKTALEEIKSFLNQLPYPVEKVKSRGKSPSQDEKDEDNDELDELREILSRWHDCMHLDLEKRKSDLVEQFVRQLMPMIETNETPKQFKSKVLALVNDTKQGKSIDTHDEDFNEHADDLVSELHYLALRRHERKNKRIRKKFLEPIYEWLMESDIPEPIKEKHRLLASRTDSKLRHMAANEADEDTMHGEIHDFLKSMPEDALQLTNKQTSRLSDLFIKQIKYGLSPMSSNEKLQVANNLLNNILPTSKKRREKSFENNQPVLDWLENNPYIEEEDKDNNRTLAKRLDKKLQQIRSNNIDSEEVENEINEFLDTLSAKGILITPDQKTALAKKVRNEMKSSAITRKKEPFLYHKSQPISDWLTNAPNVPKQIKEKHKKIVQALDDKLQEMKSQAVGNDVIEDEIIEFLDGLSKKGVPFTPEQKNKITQSVLNELQSAPSETERSKQPASDWFENASSIPKQTKQKYRELVRDFDEKLQEMKSQEVENDVLEDEIDEFLDTISRKGVPIPPTQKSDIAKTILKGLTKPRLSTKPASKWLENALNISKQVKEKNKKVFNNFEKNIQLMKADNVDEDIIQNEINKFMDSLPAKGIKVTPFEKAALAKNILKEEIKPSVVSDKQPTTEWFENAKNIPEAAKQKKKSLVENFDKKLQEMKSQNVADDIIEDEINEFMETLAKKGIPLSLKQKSDITKNLVKESTSTPAKNQTRKLSVSAWLENAPNVPKQVKDENQKAFDNFEKKIQQMIAENIDEDVIQDEINEFINTFPAKGIKVTTSEKETLAKLLGKEVIPQKAGSNQPTMEWFDNRKSIPNAVKQKNRILIENFEKNLQEMKTHSVADDIIENEINEFMDTLSKKGVLLSSKQKSDMSKQLLKESKSTTTKNQTKKPSAFSWLENAPKVPKQVKEGHKKAFDNIEKKIQQMKTENVNDDLIQNEINAFVNSFPAKGIKVTSSEKENLTTKLLAEEVKPEAVGSHHPAMEWFKNTKNIPEAVKQKTKNLVENFDIKIQEMKSQNIPDDVIKDEISEFMDTLAKQGVPLSPKQKSDIPKSFLKERNSTSANLTQFRKQSAWGWLENAPNIPAQIKQKHSNLVKDFDKKIQQLRAHNIDEETIQDEINEFVDSLPKKGINLTPKQKNELSQILRTPVSETSEFHKRRDMDWVTSSPKQIKRQKAQPLSEWFEKLSNISKQTKDTNRNLINNFDKKIEQMKANNVEEDVIQNEINEFVNSFPEKGIKLSPREKITLKSSLKDRNPASDWSDSSEKKDANEQKMLNLYEDDFVEPLTRKPNTFKNEPETSQVGYSSTSDTCEITGTLKTLRPASEWLESSADIPKEVKLRNRNFVKKFDRELNQLKSDKASDHAIENQIRHFLGDLPDKGVLVTPMEKDRLRRSLLDITEGSSSKILRPVANWLDSSTKIPERVKSKTHDIVDNFDNKLQRLRAGNATEGEIEAEIAGFLDVMKQQGIGMSPQEKAQLVKKFLAESKMMLDTFSSTETGPAKRKRWSQSSDFKQSSLKPEMRKTIKDGVNSILDEYDIPPELRDEVEKSIVDALADALLHGTSDKELENTLLDILRNTGVSDEEAKRIVSDMMKKKKQMANDFKIAALTPEMKKVINADVGNILDKYDIPLEHRDEVEKNIADALADGLLHGTCDKELENTLMNILRNAGVSDEEANKIIADMIKKKNQRAKYFKTPDSSSLPLHIMKKNINNEVGNIFDKYDNIPLEYRNEVEKKITDALSDALLHSASEKELENTLMDILRNAGVSEEEATRIVADMTKKRKQMATDFKIAALTPDIKETVNNEIGNILDKYNIPPEYRDEVDKSMTYALTDALLHGTSDKELEKTLMDILRKAGVSEEEAKRIVADMMKKKKQMAKDLTIPGSNTEAPGLSASKYAFLQNDIEKSLSKWLDDTNSLFRADKNKLRDNIPQLAENINDNMQSNKDANLFESIKDALTPWVRSANKEVVDDKLTKMAREIESALNEQGITESNFKGTAREPSQDKINRLLKAPDKFIKDAVDKWTKSLILPTANTSVLDRAKQGLVKTLKDAFVSNDGRIPPSREDEIFQDVVAQFLDDVPGHTYTSDDEKLLTDTLKSVFKETAKKFGRPVELGSKKGADVLLDEIGQWVESLPIESKTPEQKENADKMKQDIKGKLVHKIGELNMNPEIFKDDFLYEDMLEDEVDRSLLNTDSNNVKKQLPKLKKNFVDIVRKARQKIHDENAGQVYKQQLKDAIARMLPSFQFASPEERASFEILKDVIADDFINMHYVGGDPNELNRLKNRIDGNIYDFCMKHFRRCPAVPLDTKQINQALYPILESIPEPQNDSFRDEVELVKIKDIINDWVKYFRLGYQSGLKKLQASKMILVLAKKLLDIENEQLEAEEYDDKTNKEITRFLNKLPLNTNNEEELDEFANDLIQRLKDTHELRKLNSAHRHCIDACFRPCTYQPPPCTLSQEDLEHLERIKIRNTVRRKFSFKDACLSPCSVDTSTQTESKNLMDACPSFDVSLGRRTSSVQTHCRRMQAVGSQVCPNVIVNEHNWESGKTSMPTESSMSPCGMAMPHRMPCTQRGQSPIRPCPRPNCTSRQSQIQQCNPSYYQTAPPNTSNYQGQCELPQYQEPPPIPSRAQMPSRPTQYTPDDPRMPCAVQPRVPNSAQNIPQRRSRDDSYLSDPSQAVLNQGQNRPATTHPRPRNVCKPPAQISRDNGFTIRDPCPEPCMPQRGLCQGNLGNQRGPDPYMMWSRQRPGPSYHAQSSDPYSSCQDQPPRFNQQPYFMSSTPNSSEDVDPNRFQNRVTRVTHLGSFDHSERRLPNFPKFNQNTFEYEYWDTEYRSNHSSNEESPRKRCRCKPKCGKYKGRRKPCHLANDEAMSSCAKCCGVHCPFPSYMFFR